MLAGENGDLLYFESFEFRALLSGPPGSKTEATSSLVAFSGGFVAGLHIDERKSILPFRGPAGKGGHA